MNIVKKQLKNSSILAFLSILLMFSTYTMENNHKRKFDEIDGKLSEQPLKKIKMSKEQEESMFYAIEDGDLDTVNELINEKIDFNSIFSQRYCKELFCDCTLTVKTIGIRGYHKISQCTQLTPLMIAVLKKQPEIITILLKSGASINLKNEDDSDALRFAIANNQLNIVQLLLENGANPNNSLILPALFSAVISLPDLLRTNNSDDEEQSDSSSEIDDLLKIISLLIQHGANVNFQVPEGTTPFMYALEYIADADFAMYIAKLFVENNLDLNFQDNDGNTALILNNNPEITQLFIENGANVNLKNKNGNDALSWAIRDYLDGEIERLPIIKILSYYNTQFSVPGRVYIDTIQNQALINMLDEIITYKNDDSNNALQTAIKNSLAFNKYELLTLAVLNEHNKQIHYCIDQKIFTPFEILEGLALRKHMPMEIITGNLVIKTDSEEQKKLMKLAAEYNNTKFLKQFCPISRAYKTLDLFGRKQRIIEEKIPNEIVQKIMSYV